MTDQVKSIQDAIDSLGQAPAGNLNLLTDAEIEAIKPLCNPFCFSDRENAVVIRRIYNALTNRQSIHPANAPAAVSLTEREEGGAGAAIVGGKTDAENLGLRASSILINFIEYGEDGEPIDPKYKVINDFVFELVERLAASPASVSSPQRLPVELAPTRTMEVQGDEYSLNDVLEYLQERSGNPFLEAAHEFLVGNYRAATPLGVVEPAGAASPTRKGSSEWVPVGERLPEFGEDVLLFYGSELGRGRQTAGKFAQLGVNDWAAEPQNVWLNDYEPTHWAPLPTPPQP